MTPEIDAPTSEIIGACHERLLAQLVGPTQDPLWRIVASRLATLTELLDVTQRSLRVALDALEAAR